jgi:MOSC domain-containing protein YiiM
MEGWIVGSASAGGMMIQDVRRVRVDVRHLTMTELEAGLHEIRRSPSDAGELQMIVQRPGKGERQIVDEARLDCEQGLVGDNWLARGNPRTPDGLAHPDTQLTVMSTRVIALLAQDRSRWSLAGDQIFVDLDLSVANLPPGTRLAIGSAVIEATPEPHTGCAKFVQRFGLDAMKFVNSTLGRELQLRGINARVARAGVIRVGDVAKKLVT